MIKLPAHAVDRLRPALEGAACCITGGAGFIGGHIVDALLTLGARISVIDDLSNSSADHIGELVRDEPERVRFVHGSILDQEALAEAVDGCAFVFHQAAICSVPRSVEQPERVWAVNATGTMRVLRAAHAAGSRRVIFAASSSAYGNAKELPRREHMLPQPLSPYAASKLAGEALLVAFSESYGLSTIGLRYFNIFGPRQRPGGPYAGVIPAFADRLNAGQPPVIFGDGSQSRDFTYVSNAVLANLLAAASDRALTGHIVNVGAGRSFTVLELARRMARAWERDDPEPQFASARTGDVQHSQADISAAASLIDYEPFTAFEDGLERTIEWLRTPARHRP